MKNQRHDLDPSKSLDHYTSESSPPIINADHLYGIFNKHSSRARETLSFRLVV